MSDDTELEEMKEWAQSNFEGVKNAIQNVQKEMRNSKPKENINVRKVDAENLENHEDDQIIVEHSVQRWYSVNYFKKMLGNSDSNNSSSDEEDVLFGDEE